MHVSVKVKGQGLLFVRERKRRHRKKVLNVVTATSRLFHMSSWGSVIDD